MYLVTRSGRFAPGSTRDVVSYVGEVTEKVRQETGLRVDAWSSTFSPDLGTVVWAVFAEDLAVLEQANDKLATSDSYIDLVDRGAQLFAGPASDGLAPARRPGRRRLPSSRKPTRWPPCRWCSRSCSPRPG